MYNKTQYAKRGTFPLLPSFTYGNNRLVGLVLKASASRVADLGSIPTFAVGIFPGWVIPVNYNLIAQWLPCQVPGVIGSVLGLVGPVSVYCDWER